MTTHEKAMDHAVAAYNISGPGLAHPKQLASAIATYLSTLLSGDAGELVPVAWRARRSEQENWYLHESPVGWWECQALVPAREAASLIQSQAAEGERWRAEYMNAASDAQKFAARIAELEGALVAPTGEMMDEVRHIVQWLQMGNPPTEAALFTQSKLRGKDIPETCRDGVNHVPPARLIAFWIWNGMGSSLLTKDRQP